MMATMEQPGNFLEECKGVRALLDGRSEEDFERVTLFKGWTIADVIRHLYVWDTAARLTVEDSAAFEEFFRPVPGYYEGDRIRDFEREKAPFEGRALFERWWDNARETAALYARTDPKLRLKWGGPPLSARSCITSRLMETWSHTQAVYDELGLVRADGDWIRNVAQIGMQTFGWTFANRGIEPPGPVPSVVLTAPSGAEWRWDNPDSPDRISGSATEFCQVVAQTRNIADTRLRVEGSVATAWMAIAQCFAGAPADPPPPGARHINRAAGLV